MLVQKTREQRLKKEVHVEQKARQPYALLVLGKRDSLPSKQHFDDGNSGSVRRDEPVHLPLQFLQGMDIQSDRRDALLQETDKAKEVNAQHAITGQTRCQVQALQEDLIDQAILQAR